MCTVGCDGSSSSEEAEPHNIWNALLAALVHFHIGEVLQAAAHSGGFGQGGVDLPFTVAVIQERDENGRKCDQHHSAATGVWQGSTLSGVRWQV